MANTDDQVIASLQKSRDNILRLIEEVTSEPKPTYSIDGQKVDWADYLETLQKALEKIEESLSNKDGIFEEHSTLYNPG